MKQRAAGALLLLLLTLPAVAGWVWTFLLILFGPIDRARAALWGLDMFGNSSTFSGNPHESISSHVGRLVQTPAPPWWARALNAFLNLLQPGHCVGANKLEQPVLDAIAIAKRK